MMYDIQNVDIDYDFANNTWDTLSKFASCLLYNNRSKLIDFGKLIYSYLPMFAYFKLCDKHRGLETAIIFTPNVMRDISNFIMKFSIPIVMNSIYLSSNENNLLILQQFFVGIFFSQEKFTLSQKLINASIFALPAIIGSDIHFNGVDDKGLGIIHYNILAIYKENIIFNYYKEFISKLLKNKGIIKKDSVITNVAVGAGICISKAQSNNALKGDYGGLNSVYARKSTLQYYLCISIFEALKGMINLGFSYIKINNEKLKLLSQVSCVVMAAYIMYNIDHSKIEILSSNKCDYISYLPRYAANSILTICASNAMLKLAKGVKLNLSNQLYQSMVYALTYASVRMFDDLETAFYPSKKVIDSCGTDYHESIIFTSIAIISYCAYLMYDAIQIKPIEQKGYKITKDNKDTEINMIAKELKKTDEILDTLDKLYYTIKGNLPDDEFDSRRLELRKDIGDIFVDYDFAFDDLKKDFEKLKKEKGEVLLSQIINLKEKINNLQTDVINTFFKNFTKYKKYKDGSTNFKSSSLCKAVTSIRIPSYMYKNANESAKKSRI